MRERTHAQNLSSGRMALITGGIDNIVFKLGTHFSRNIDTDSVDECVSDENFSIAQCTRQMHSATLSEYVFVFYG